VRCGWFIGWQGGFNAILCRKLATTAEEILGSHLDHVTWSWEAATTGSWVTEIEKMHLIVVVIMDCEEQSSMLMCAGVVLYLFANFALSKGHLYKSDNSNECGWREEEKKDEGRKRRVPLQPAR
jgi:hypothetical protein